MGLTNCVKQLIHIWDRDRLNELSSLSALFSYLHPSTALSTFLRYKEKRADDCLKSSFHSEHQQFQIAINSGSGHFRTAQERRFLCYMPWWYKEALPAQADFLDLRAIERYQLHGWRAELQELPLRLSLLLLLLLLLIIIIIIIIIIIFCVTVSYLVFVGTYQVLMPCWEGKIVNFCFNLCYTQRTCSRKQTQRKRSYLLSQMHESSEHEYITAPVLLINVLRLPKQFYSLFSKNDKGWKVHNLFKT